MPPNDPHPISLFEQAVDIPRWLEADRELRFSDRSRRDRASGLASGSHEPLERIGYWWEQMEPDPGIGRRLEQLRGWTAVGLLGVGLIAGLTVSLAVLRYDGQYPVNIVTVLAVLVGAPLGLLAVSLLLLPRRLPGLAAVQDLVATANIGNLAVSVIARFSTETAEHLRAFAYSSARAGPTARFAKWQLLVWSQMAGLGFALGALGGSFALVVFTDLAFGWSTTLDVTPTEAQAITDAIASPWAAWLPSASPDATLIEASRYFRLDREGGIGVPAERLTGWWPFLLATLVVWGLGPRAVMLLIARARLRAATVQLLLDDPDVRALLDRMSSQFVDLDERGRCPGTLGKTRHEDLTDPLLDSGARTTTLAPAGRAGLRALIWNRALEADVREDWLRSHSCTIAFDVGGKNSLAQDREVLTQLDPRDTTPVVVLTKAWEPPLGDFTDFVAAIRDRLGPNTSIMVLPLGLAGSAASLDEVRMWRHGIAPLGDPAVYVEGLDG